MVFLTPRDGSVNPGHLCFDHTAPLSPISQIPGSVSTGGLVRVGDCAEVYAGWDHTEVVANDPNTYHYAALVYAHFHVHADNIDLGEYRRRQHCVISSGSGSKGTSLNLRQHPPPHDNNHLELQHLRESTPSMGDIGAWIGYHRNLSNAFVLTRNTSWLLCKWNVPGHGKGGMECPLETITPWLEECQRRCFEPITEGKDLLKEIAEHGFVIYTRKLAHREPDTDGVYQLWNCDLRP